LKKPRPKVIELGLDLTSISTDFLQDLALVVENTIREYVESELGRRLEQLNIIVNVEVNDSLRIIVNVELLGKSRGRIDYDVLLDEAIKEAYRVAEEVLEHVKRGRGEGTQASGSAKGSSDTSDNNT